MTNPLRLLLAAALPAAALTAQLQTVLFTGRFPFTSQSAAYERPNGAISRLEEFDFSYSIPVPGFAAKTLLPATAMQCYLGDGNTDGNYLKFANWKTYFQQIGIGGIFVKASDRAAVTWDKVWFTVRRNAAATGGNSPGTLQIEVLTNNGTTPYTLVPGDWLRLLPNGNVEFFLRQTQLVTAVGAQSGSATIGAGALLQAANGDLYYSPVDGSHWVNGNQGGTSVAYDGAILKIDAANITYDANGNVQALAPNSARILINEITTVPNVRGLVAASGAVDRFGAALSAPAYGYGKTVGLAFDPNGGTFTPALPNSTGAFPPEPHLLFVSDGGSYAGTIFSTANNGSIATINGLLCGSNQLGVPANGSWLGVVQDAANFQPTYMGFTLCDAISETPLVIDQNGFGSLPLASAQATWDVDVSTQPTTAVFLFLSLGPTGPGTAPLSVPTGFVPLGFTADSWDDVFLTGGLATFGFTVTDANGLGTVTVPNPNTGGYTGVTLIVQGVGLAPGGFQLSTPLLAQLQ
jgi:hypothetical protein